MLRDHDLADDMIHNLGVNTADRCREIYNGAQSETAENRNSGNKLKIECIATVLKKIFEIIG